MIIHHRLLCEDCGSDCELFEVERTKDYRDHICLECVNKIEDEENKEGDDDE